MSALRIKICGLSTPRTLETALEAGADMVGFVFHPKSPRFVTPDEAARLAAAARGQAEIVALLVDKDDAAIDAIIAAVKPDLLQFHGRETPARLAEIRKRTGLPVMRAVGVMTVDDLAAIDPYVRIADRLLIDAKPPPDAAYPGGHGVPFDWSILRALDRRLNYVLSGGLTPDNVAEAVRRVRPLAVDVSSGVETAPGIKDAGMIRAFIEAARAAR